MTDLLVQSPGGEPIFELAGVRYVYNDRQVALDGIDLVVRSGEQVVLLGANGSGKSTLLKLLDGIIAPTSGRMRALGLEIRAVVDGYDAFRFHRQVGLVFQDPDIQLFSATVLDDVAFGPLQLGLPAADVEARCDEALDIMEIRHLAGRAPFELSGGEKKRAAIASVLSLRPDVILLDEPTAALDPRTKWVLVNLIRRLGEDRRVHADGAPAAVLGNRDLLIAANLIHEHLHEHGGIRHSHPHATDESHDGIDVDDDGLPGVAPDAIAQGTGPAR